MLKKIFFTVAALVSLMPVFAELSFDTLAGTVQTFWSDTNGLPSNRLLDIVQDETGYIWLASYDGLFRFDGDTFTEFTAEEHGFTGISPRVLCEDVYGSLWIGTNATGLYEYRNKRFYSYGLQEGLPNVSVRAVKFDKYNTLWVGTADGLVQLDKTRRFVPVPAGNGQSLGIISFILPVNDTVFVGSNLKGITAIRNGQATELPFLKQMANYMFSAAYASSDGLLWFGTKDGIIVKVKDEKIVEIIDSEYLAGTGINEFLRARNGTMYAATNKGIVTLKPDKIELFSEANGLPNNIVSSLCQDHEENLWAAMERGGLGKFSRGKFLDLTSAQSLPAAAANAVVEDVDKNIWIAKDDGVVCLKSSSLLPERSGRIDALIAALQNIRVRQIREEEDGTLFFATYSDKGLVVFSQDGQIRFITKKNGLPNNRVRFSYRSSNGLLWIGTTAGPAVYHNGKITAFTQDDGLPNLFMLCAQEDQNGSMWFGTDGGGAVELSVDGLSAGMLKIKTEHIYTKEEGLSGNVVFRIVQDPEGLWFCTGEGVTLYKNGTFHPADKALGFSKAGVFNIIRDKTDNLWIVTAKELLLIKREHLTQAVLANEPAENLIRYNRLDGLTGQLAANAWAYLSEKNTLFIPTLKGVAVCDPTYYIANKHTPPVVIENIFLDGKKLDTPLTAFTVNADTKRILFKFTALSFTIPQRVQFEYQLEGYDTEWKSCGSSREIAYTNLNPGNYVFRVRAANNDGFLNKEGAAAAFYKKPFFYQTVWFYLVIAVCIGGTVFFTVQLRFKVLQRRADELDKKVKEKTKALAAEKEKSDQLLKNTLPLPIIDELIQTGTSTPKVYPAVTVLFADLVSFTEWSGNHPPETVISELNTLFTLFDDIMDTFGCDRIKTLGDGYLACCGLRGEKDHAVRLTGAAIEMLHAVERLNGKNSNRFQIKIGIDSGPITGGIVGVHKYIFDIFGDTVNTAFRLESVTAPMACTVSEKTAEQIYTVHTVYRRPNQNLKGKGLTPAYYINYRHPETVWNFAEIKNLYEELRKQFQDKNFERCRAIIAKLDRTLLEPNMAKDALLIEKALSA